MTTPEFHESKFKELILHIASRCEYDPYFGAVKLNKTLFLSDMCAYLELGNAITGAEYIALEHGPGPKLMMPIRADMEQAREMRRALRDKGGTGTRYKVASPIDRRRVVVGEDASHDPRTVHLRHQR